MAIVLDQSGTGSTEVTVSTSQDWEILLVATAATGGTVTSITDTAGLTWTKLGAWSVTLQTQGLALAGGGYELNNFPGSDLEIWWAYAVNQLTNDTITVNFGGSPSNQGLSWSSFIGVDYITPWQSNAITTITGVLGEYQNDILVVPGWGNSFDSLLSNISTLTLNVAISTYGLIAATDFPDVWSATSFQEITGITGGDGYGTGTGTVTTPGVMGEPVGPPSTGLSPGYPLPFTFAWVDAGDTVFEVGRHARVDEEIFSIDLKHEEGQIPTLEIEIKNPRIGLLNPSRKQWAWLAYQPPPTSSGPAPFFEAGDFSGIPNGYGSSGSINNVAPYSEGTPEYVVDGYVLPGYQVYDGATIPITPPVPAPPPPPPPSFSTEWVPGETIVPIFFGELVGVPSDLFAEKITLKFIARPMNYIEQKQAVAETLKIPGNYEPIFLDEKHRDEPDAILEGWSSLYHVDRVTQQVSASDVLVGEDGTIIFPGSPAGQSAIYKNMKVKSGKAPLANVQVQANVQWTQRTVGYVNGPPVNVQSYTGGTFASDWEGMKGKGLGGGWTVESVFVDDPYLVAHTPTWHISTNQTFYGDVIDYDCAIVSVAESQSGPALLGPALMGQVVTTADEGICNPGSNPPTNLPTRIELQRVFIPLWALMCTWTLRYNAKREFSEMCIFDVTANTQAVLTSPTVEQNTELIKISGQVGQPVMVYDAWSDFENSYVDVGQLIFPDNPITPGGLSYQICVGAGVTGTVEPVFSDVPGTTTDDGGAVWASLGENPQSVTQRMTFNTSYNIGTILVYVTQVFDPYSGTMIDTTASQYYIVVQSCSTTGAYTLVTYAPPITESDQLLFPQATITVSTEQFSPVSGMMPLTSVPGIPAGGTAENVVARFFFPSSRGKYSLLYGINRARAKIRMRSRAVDVSWDCAFDMVLGMSCRKNATVYDPRLPGGVATGKVTSYGMTAKGGKMRGHVTIGCAVGYNSFGNPSPDISYTPPVFVPFDDGLNFPLSALPSDGGVFTSSIGSQIAALETGIQYELQAMKVQNPPVPQQQTQTGTGGETLTVTGITPPQAWTASEDAAYLPAIMESNPIGWTMEIQPVTNRTFAGAYNVAVSPLELPMGIDLTAASEE